MTDRISTYPKTAIWAVKDHWSYDGLMASWTRLFLDSFLVYTIWWLSTLKNKSTDKYVKNVGEKTRFLADCGHLIGVEYIVGVFYRKWFYFFQKASTNVSSPNSHISLLNFTPQKFGMCDQVICLENHIKLFPHFMKTKNHFTDQTQAI